jgi:hypothetical protein
LSFFSDTTNEWMVGGFCQMWMVKVSATSMNKPLPKQGLFLKAGEAIRTPDIHVGNVQAHRPDGINRIDFLR